MNRQNRYYKKNKSKINEKRRKKTIAEKLPEDEELISLVVKLLQSNLRIKSNEELLLKCLKKLQRQKGLTIEYLKYLVLSEFYPNADKLMYSEFGTKKSHKEILKLTRLLKRNKVKIIKQPTTYYRWVNQIDLRKIPEQRYLSRFEIK